MLWDIVASKWESYVIFGCYVYALVAFIWLLIHEPGMLDKTIAEIVREMPDLGISLAILVTLAPILIAGVLTKYVMVIYY